MDFGSFPKDQRIRWNSYLIDNSTNFNTLFYIIDYAILSHEFWNMSAPWWCVMFVQMCYVCENVRAGRVFWGYQHVCRLNQTNQLNTHTHAHTNTCVHIWTPWKLKPSNHGVLTLLQGLFIHFPSSTGLPASVSPCYIQFALSDGSF